MRRMIINKALKCVDEIYPDDNSVNALSFPMDGFLDEAARQVIKAAPLHALGPGEDMTREAQPQPNADGSGSIRLPQDFIRLIVFRMEGWKRPVTMPVRPADPLYGKQHNRITRGGVVKPVVALIKGDSILEYFSLPEGVDHKIAEGRWLRFSSVDVKYPSKLVDATAWQLAALVLSSMNDTAQAGVAQQRANEIIAML